MKKFIIQYKFVLIAAIIAFIFVFFCIPFILTNSALNGGGVNPCPTNSGQFGALCNLSVPDTLYGYFQNREPIVSISWNIPIIVFIITFTITYGTIKIIILIIKFPRKKHRLTILALKVVALSTLVYVLFSLINIVLCFLGIGWSYNVISPTEEYCQFLFNFSIWRYIFP